MKNRKIDATLALINMILFAYFGYLFEVEGEDKGVETLVTLALSIIFTARTIKRKKWK